MRLNEIVRKTYASLGDSIDPMKIIKSIYTKILVPMGIVYDGDLSEEEFFEELSYYVKFKKHKKSDPLGVIDNAVSFTKKGSPGLDIVSGFHGMLYVRLLRARSVTYDTRNYNRLTPVISKHSVGLDARSKLAFRLDVRVVHDGVHDINTAENGDIKLSNRAVSELYSILKMVRNIADEKFRRGELIPFQRTTDDDRYIIDREPDDYPSVPEDEEERTNDSIIGIKEIMAYNETIASAVKKAASRIPGEGRAAVEMVDDAWNNWLKTITDSGIQSATYHNRNYNDPNWKDKKY